MIELLLQATRDRIRCQLKLADGQCDIQPDGHPPARMGEFYISLDEGGIQSADKGFLKEVFSIDVFITKRTGVYPKDQYRRIYLDNATGLASLERKIIAAVHGSQELRVAANTLGDLPSTENGDAFQFPLYYMGRSKTRSAGGEWSGSAKENDCFLVRALRFTGGNRIQALDIMH
jgi:hypothetical protein